jgi:hypothetical protein
LLKEPEVVKVVEELERESELDP